MTDLFGRLAETANRPLPTPKQRPDPPADTVPEPPSEPARPRRRPAVTRADQLQEYIDLLLDLDQAHPSDELHDRIERALAELHRERDDARERQIMYTVPLRPGTPFVQITLPMDLTAAEADRLAGVIKAVAFGNTD